MVKRMLEAVMEYPRNIMRSNSSSANGSMRVKYSKVHWKVSHRYGGYMLDSDGI